MSASGARRRGRVFGLEVEADFNLPMLPASGRRSRARRTVLELVDSKTLRSRWPAREAERSNEALRANGDLDFAVDRHPEAGYLLTAHRLGRFVVAADGTRVQCAPGRVASWRWARFMLAQVLPMAATARGLEVFHASAVSLANRAVAVVGPTGTGKTSLAARLVTRGAGFLTDDVLAVEGRGDSLIAHPGPPVANMRDASTRGLGRALAEADDRVYLSVDTPDQTTVTAVPLGAMYFPEVGGSGIDVEVMRPLDPRLLLVNSFNWTIETRARLSNQLDICARIAASVPLLRLSMAADVGPEQVAAVVEEHALTTLSNVDRVA